MIPGGSPTLALVFSLSPTLIDPALPVEIRHEIEKVAAAELDPKRGPDRALARLGELEQIHRDDPRLYAALQLRSAGVFLRKRFLRATRFPAPVRHQQALSTFSRLDLTEPGLSTWVERALDATRRDRTGEDKPPAERRIPIALLIRGSVLKRPVAQASLNAPFSALGFPLAFVSTREARFVLKLGVSDAPAPSPALRAVRVSLDIEGRTARHRLNWEHSFFRTEAAAEIEPAIEAALEWLARIGGRDLFFHWLSTTSMPFLAKNPFARHRTPHPH